MVWLYGEYRLSPIMNYAPIMSGNSLLSLIEELFDSPLQSLGGHYVGMIMLGKWVVHYWERGHTKRGTKLSCHQLYAG